MTEVLCSLLGIRTARCALLIKQCEWCGNDDDEEDDHNEIGEVEDDHDDHEQMKMLKMIKRWR